MAWHKKNKVGMGIALFITIVGLLGWRAAVGLFIGAAVGAIAGICMGASISLLTGTLVNTIIHQREFTPRLNILIRLAIGCVVGAAHGAGIGLAVSHIDNLLANIIMGTAIGAFIGMDIARRVTSHSDPAIMSESNSLEGGGLGMPIGILLGMVIGASMMARGGLINMIIVWFHQ